jgi:hypothetical protein
VSDPHLVSCRAPARWSSGAGVQGTDNEQLRYALNNSRALRFTSFFCGLRLLEENG